jgi:hypothetical protein
VSMNKMVNLSADCLYDVLRTTSWHPWNWRDMGVRWAWGYDGMNRTARKRKDCTCHKTNREANEAMVSAPYEITQGPVQTLQNKWSRVLAVIRGNAGLKTMWESSSLEITDPVLFYFYAWLTAFCHRYDRSK